MKQHIVVDGQILQTNAWHRGMGKYTLQLLTELSRQYSSGLDIHIIFNTNIECEAERYETVKYLCPEVKQHFTKLPITSQKFVSRKKYQKKLSTFIRKEFSDQDNISFLITSLFSFDFYAEFPDAGKKLLLFYDLTPLLFWKDLGGYFPPHLYMDRFDVVYAADHLFSISDTVKNDLVKVFGLAEEEITNIDGGVSDLSVESSRPDMEVPKDFVLFPSGDLPHKNNEVAFKAMATLEKTMPELRLLVTSNFSEEHRAAYQKYSKNIVFTGNVTDEELHWLYQNASAVLFASKYEGLGIPILDAIENNKPVVASEIPVFEEMSKTSFYFFDPNDDNELVAQLKAALVKDDFKQRTKDYPAISHKYTWKETARKFYEGLAWSSTKHDVLSDPAMRIAIVAPSPGMANQVGRVAEPLYGLLTKRGDIKIDYFFDGAGLSPKTLDRPTFLDYLDCDVYEIAHLSLARYRSYDKVIFLLDEKCVGTQIITFASTLPGVAVFLGVKNEVEKNQQLRVVLANHDTAIYLPRDFSTTKLKDLSEQLAAPDKKQVSNPRKTILFQRHVLKSTIMKQVIQQIKSND